MPAGACPLPGPRQPAGSGRAALSRAAGPQVRASVGGASAAPLRLQPAAGASAAAVASVVGCCASWLQAADSVSPQLRQRCSFLDRPRGENQGQKTGRSLGRRVERGPRVPPQHPRPGRPPPAPGAAPSHAEPRVAGLLPSALGGRPDFVVVSSAAHWTKVRAWQVAAQVLLSDLRLGSL